MKRKEKEGEELQVWWNNDTGSGVAYGQIISFLSMPELDNIFFKKNYKQVINESLGVDHYSHNVF